MPLEGGADEEWSEAWAEYKRECAEEAAEAAAAGITDADVANQTAPNPEPQKPAPLSDGPTHTHPHAHTCCWPSLAVQRRNAVGLATSATQEQSYAFFARLRPPFRFRHRSQPVTFSLLVLLSLLHLAPAAISQIRGVMSGIKLKPPIWALGSAKQRHRQQQQLQLWLSPDSCQRKLRACCTWEFAITTGFGTFERRVSGRGRFSAFVLRPC
jgi:hypothetical protein